MYQTSAQANPTFFNSIYHEQKIKNVNVVENEVIEIRIAANVLDPENIADAQDPEAENVEGEVDLALQETSKTIFQDAVNLLSTGMYLLQALNTSLLYNTKPCKQLDRFLLIL